MFRLQKINKLEDFFLDLDKRSQRGVYFYRINGYTKEVAELIREYYLQASTLGMVIEGKLQNPDDKNLAYYEEIMGMNFSLNGDFLAKSLKKWLPFLTDIKVRDLASAVYECLEELKKAGKNENILKNAYIKFMCWLYYRFSRVLDFLNSGKVPKILYEGEISNHELLFMSVLSKAGCDILLLQYKGDAAYLKLDSDSSLSYPLEVQAMGAFPEGFCIKTVRDEAEAKKSRQKLYGKLSSLQNCTNAWIEGKGPDDIKTAVNLRGSDENLFYNAYIRINGVDDKSSYLNELYKFYNELKTAGRRVFVQNGSITLPSTFEIAEIKRQNYANKEQMIVGLSENIRFSNIELQKIMIRTFVDILSDEAEATNESLNRLTNKAVYLLCWLKRYMAELFSATKIKDISCFIYMGACQNDIEALFIKLLARLPLDILILKPDLSAKSSLSDSLLYEINNTESLSVKTFPTESSPIKMGTLAYHAERELDNIMYTDSGMYRNMQYKKANVVNLQTMYEEIDILWKEELKYRPNFGTINETVTLPVIFAKVSGVKDADLGKYWMQIKELCDKKEDCILIKDVNYITATGENPVKPYVTQFYKNSRLKKDLIKSHSSYQYSFLREEVQDYILDKLQELIASKLIKGTFENGTEYTIISLILNLPKEILRLIQKFDFTKKNPKLVYIGVSERMISLEDTICIQFLNLVGFDIVFFIPTGYQNVETHLNRRLFEEYKIGEYMYDLTIPDFTKIKKASEPKTWYERIFKRGK